MLKTVVAANVAANTPFTIIVPGTEIWTVLAVAATLSRAAGGVPTRALRLAISDGTRTVLTSPAADAGTEPGTLTATWTNAQPATSSSGGTGVTLGPLPTVTLLPGYSIVGTVIGGVAADQWTTASVWVDFRVSG